MPGFNAPTPTTVVGAAEIEKQANPNVFTTVTQLPSLQGSTGTSVGNGGSSNGVNGLSALNLRNIGTNRNLVLVDGERIVPASTQGVVDVSQLPQLLIQRVDVVTGGASASWGSDAVTGVVNFILDKHFEGFKANLNGGITTYADDPQAQVQFAAGTSFAGGKAHLEFSGEFTSEAGVNSILGPRTWYKNPQQLQMFSAASCTPGNASAGPCATAKAPMWTNVNNGVLAQWSTGGLITGGPLQGTAFGPNGKHLSVQLWLRPGRRGRRADPGSGGSVARRGQWRHHQLLRRRLLLRRRHLGQPDRLCLDGRAAGARQCLWPPRL